MNDKPTTLRAVATARGEILQIDPRLIQIKPGWNSRNMESAETLAHVDDLYNSIKTNGVRQPLRVWMEDNTVFVDSGHCRLAAVTRLIADGIDIKTVPCLAEPRGTNEADRLVGQITDNEGQPLNPLEKGANFKRLIAFGWEIPEIVEKTGYTTERVKQLLDLQSAPAPMKKMIESGLVTATFVQKVRRQADSDTAAMETLKGAVEQAKALGHKRASGKHAGTSTTVGKAKMNARSFATSIFRIEGERDDVTETVLVAIPYALYDAMQAELPKSPEERARAAEERSAKRKAEREAKAKERAEKKAERDAAKKAKADERAAKKAERDEKKAERERDRQAKLLERAEKEAEKARKAKEKADEAKKAARAAERKAKAKADKPAKGKAREAEDLL